MDIQDLLSVDIDELGVRPLNWTDDVNDSTTDYFRKEKLTGFSNNEKNLTIDEEDALIPDEDESNYAIDPETGEKIFCEVPVASSPCLSSSNDWIEEYLFRLESSSPPPTHQLVPLTSELLFEDISISTEQTDSNWLSNFDESTNQIMFPDENDKHLLQTSSPIFLPILNKPTPDAFMNMFNGSIDDEHSLTNSSNSQRRSRLFSSLEGDSTTRDSEMTLDESFAQTKLEKIEHDDPSIPQMFVRRLSARPNYQGQQDEETLQRYNIPLTLYQITQSSTDEYNRHLAHLNHLSPEQMHIIKDIRRRGKNKIAAQNCRKRKASNVETLLEEVDELKRAKHDLEQRKKSYQQQIIETRNQYEYLHRQVLPDRQLPPAIIVK